MTYGLLRNVQDHAGGFTDLPGPIQILNEFHVLQAGTIRKSAWMVLDSAGMNRDDPGLSGTVRGHIRGGPGLCLDDPGLYLDGPG